MNLEEEILNLKEKLIQEKAEARDEKIRLDTNTVFLKVHRSCYRNKVISRIELNKFKFEAFTKFKL